MSPSPSGFTRWPNHLFDAELRPPEKLVLLALLAHEFKPGEEVTPSHGTIAQMTGLSVRTVIRVIESLVDGGYIKRRHRPGDGAGRASNAYRISATAALSPSATAALSPGAQVPRRQLASATQSHEEDVKTEESFSEDAKRLCSHLAELAKRQNPDHRIHNRTTWLTDMQSLLDEGHSPDRVREILTFAFNDDFWSQRIPAPASLIKSWNNLTAQCPHRQTVADLLAAAEQRQARIAQ